MSKFTNPADKLSLIASVPKKVLSFDITILQLVEENKTKNWRHMTIGCDDRIKILEG